MRYEFTKEGVAAFIAAALEDATENDAELDIFVGEQRITIPLDADIFEEMETLLDEALAIVEEYTEGAK